MSADSVRRTLCLRVIQALSAKYQWNLLSEEEWVKQIYDLVQASGIENETTIRNYALQIYSAHLYTTAQIKESSQTDNSVNRNRVFEELGRYLYSCAIRKYDAALAQELVQDALYFVWQEFDGCKKPETFLRFCLYKLQKAATYYFRQRQKLEKYEESIPQPKDQGQATTELIDSKQPLPETQTLCQETLNDLFTRFAQLRQERPRAVRWLDAVYDTDVLDLTDQEIADKLGTTVLNMQSLRSKGRKLLRDDQTMQAIAERIRSCCG